jgi:hypothetical protein
VFTTVRPESFVPADHPLRPIRPGVNDVLGKMDASFSAMYESEGKEGQGRSADDADHGGLQPHEVAHVGRGAAAMRVISNKCAKVALVGPHNDRVERC